MTKQYVCQICGQHLSCKRRLIGHCEKIHMISIENLSVDSPNPTYHALISEISELRAELKEIKSGQKEQSEKTEKLHLELQQNIGELANKSPTNITNNQTLNIICVTGHDNYLDMLTDRMGDFNQAIGYIKDCALSDLAGDCKLIEKIYGNQKHGLSFTIHPKQPKVTYHNEHQQLTTETKDLFARKLANNLQNSYLKSINHLINNNLNNRRDPNQLLTDYDLVSWNQHIYQLSDHQHQRKLLIQLQISI